MADDNSARYRLNDPYGRGPASAEPASDPLAELARLIGQNEPASEYRRERRLPAQPESSTRQDADRTSYFNDVPVVAQIFQRKPLFFASCAENGLKQQPQLGKSFLGQELRHYNFPWTIVLRGRQSSMFIPV